MFIYTHSSNKIVHLSRIDSSYLQALEGTAIQRSFTYLTPSFPLQTCTNWSYSGSNFSETGKPTDEIMLLHEKCNALLKLHNMIWSVRRPFYKTLPDQSLIYQRKYEEALEYVNAEEKPALNTLQYLADEVEITNKDPLVVALEIVTTKDRQDFIYRVSEKSRRILTNRICLSTSTDELSIHSNMIIPKSFVLGL